LNYLSRNRDGINNIWIILIPTLNLELLSLSLAQTEGRVNFPPLVAAAMEKSYWTLPVQRRFDTWDFGGRREVPITKFAYCRKLVQLASLNMTQET
jgi:hypothetical protein